MATIDTSWHPVALPDTGGSAFLSYSSALRDSANKLLENVVSQRQKDRELAQAELRDKLANDLAVAKLEQDAKQNAITNMLKAFEIDNTTQYNADRLKLLQDNNDLRRELSLAKLTGARDGTGGGIGGSGANASLLKTLQSLKEAAQKTLASGNIDLSAKSPLSKEALIGISWVMNHPEKKINGVPASEMLRAFYSMNSTATMAAINNVPSKFFGLVPNTEKAAGNFVLNALKNYSASHPNDYVTYANNQKDAQTQLALVNTIISEMLGYREPSQGANKTTNTTGTTNTTNTSNTNNTQTGSDLLRRNN